MNKIIMLLILGLGFGLNTACVVSPLDNPSVGVGVGASVKINPQIVLKSRSGVTVRIGPTYTVEDAFVLADRHCRSFGYYAVASKNWPHQYNNPRNLAYYCKQRGPASIPYGHRKDHNGHKKGWKKYHKHKY